MAVPLKLDLVPYLTLDEATFRKALDYFTEAYHNAQAILDDQTYDDLLQIFEDRFGSYLQVGAVPRGEKVKLPYYLGSLRKLKNENNFKTWSNNYPGPYVIQDKVDGLTLLYVIRDGTYRLYTRGAGVEGLDVSHMIDFLRLPKLGFNLAVRGEVVMFKETFIKIGAGFANARNMVSGLVNSKESFNPAIASQLHYLAFRVMDSDQTPEIQIGQLKAVGFETPWAVSTPTITFPEFDPILLQRKAQAPYEVDGIVIYQNRVEEYPEAENPRHVVAYKGVSENAIVTVITVIWQASMYRKLKPVVIYDPVFLSGATLNRASGKNARFIGENGIGPGAVIRVTRSGDTIPDVLEVLTKVQPLYPDPARHGEYHYDGVDIILNQDNREVRAAKMEHFLDLLDIKGMGPGRVKSLTEVGITSTAELLQTPVERFLAVPGLGNTLANQLFQELQTKTKGVPLSRIMAASTIFPNFGTRRLQSIVTAIPNVLQMASDPTLASKVQQIGGFNSLAFDFANALPQFIAWYKEHPSITLQEQPTAVRGTSLSGMTFLFSGFRDKELEDTIARKGGRVTTSISGKTTMVIMANINDRKGKAEEATRRGIPLISRAEFEMTYLR